MGRPPIGARALTAAEKMRRYRARKATAAFGNDASVTKPAGGGTAALAQTERELAQAKGAHPRAGAGGPRPGPGSPRRAPPAHNQAQGGQGYARRNPSTKP